MNLEQLNHVLNHLFRRFTSNWLVRIHAHPRRGKVDKNCTNKRRRTQRQILSGLPLKWFVPKSNVQVPDSIYSPIVQHCFWHCFFVLDPLEQFSLFGLDSCRSETVFWVSFLPSLISGDAILSNNWKDSFSFLFLLSASSCITLNRAKVIFVAQRFYDFRSRAMLRFQST
jgi:hypothetical protein